jgi:hypothetical protein
MLFRIFSVSILLCAALAQPALAQTLYKSTLPDGRVVYGDKPAPGAVKSEEQRPDISKKGVTPPTADGAAAARSLEKDRQKREVNAGKVEAAEKALRDAEAARAAGKDPTEGDRQGTVSGNQRLTDAYWERQKRLEAGLEQARKNLDEARAGR